MDRALAAEHLNLAFGADNLSELPTIEELTGLIADLEVGLVRGLAADEYGEAQTPLRRAAWYLHGVASTPESSRYPATQRQRAFAVSAHVLDLLLDDPADTGSRRLNAAFAAQVGYHRADQSPNAAAIHRRLRAELGEAADFVDAGPVALQAGILFLGLALADLQRHLRTWASEAGRLTRGTELENLDGTTFGPTQRLLRGVADLVAYLREGDTTSLDSGRENLLQVVRGSVGLSDLDSRWVAGHLLSIADGLGQNSIWAVLPPELPAAVKQAFTLDTAPVLTLWPPQRDLLTSNQNPLDPATTRLLVSVPTSAGKTLMAQLIICAHTVSDDRDVCYVTPLRSLGREMRQSLRPRLRYLDRRLGADLPDGFGTNDPTENRATDEAGIGPADGTPARARVEVMTPERLMNSLRQSPQDVLDRFSLFVIDEAHLIAASGGRGLLMEGLLAVLDSSGARLMLLSGVVGNAGALATWTSGGSGDVLFTDDWRAPRRLHVLTGTERIDESRAVLPGRGSRPGKTRYDLRARLAVKPTSSSTHQLATTTPIGELVLKADGTKDAKSTAGYVTTARTAALLLRAGSLLMVVSTRNLARDAAKVMAADLEDDPGSQGLADGLAARLGDAHPLVGCVRKGIGYHHAGLPVEVQEAVEDAIRDETLRAVVATRTLTDGVNLPVRTVVIATTEYVGQDPGERMTPAQLLNAVGRAGRAGKESEGWIVMALQKQLQPADFARLTPTASELEVHSTLEADAALEALAEAEQLIATTHDAILRLPHDGEAGGFVNYVWFVLHAVGLVPDLAGSGSWRDVVERLFAFTQLDESLKQRWLALADKVATEFAQTPPESRRRWAQTGSSLGSAARIELIATRLADGVQLAGGLGEYSLVETLDLLADEDVYAQLLELPEGARVWRFRVARTGQPLTVAPAGVVRDWVSGLDLTALADRHVEAVPDPVWRLEQMVDAISEGVQHYLAWTVGLVVAQANEILLNRLSPRQLLSTTAAHLRYGVDTPLAVKLLVSDLKSRTFARDLGRLARNSDWDEDGLREYLSELHIRGWREQYAATPTDVLDLLAFVQGRDRHKLATLMSSGAVTAHIRATDAPLPEGPVAVTVVATDDGATLELRTSDGTAVGVVIARDHAGVQAVLDSGLLLDVTIEGEIVTFTRAAAGQLSFT